MNDVGEPCAGEPHARFEVAAGGIPGPVGHAVQSVESSRRPYSSERLTGSVLRVGSKTPKVIAAGLYGPEQPRLERSSAHVLIEKAEHALPAVTRGRLVVADSHRRGHSREPALPAVNLREEGVSGLVIGLFGVAVCSGPGVDA